MKRRELQYVLKDILELKYPERAHDHARLAKGLFRENHKVKAVYPVPGYLFGQTLLLIKNGTKGRIRKLILLESTGTQEFLIRALPQTPNSPHIR
jgi:hypothetical protein